MAIKKSDRQIVFQKYGGRCAYCGKAIYIEDMQVDHILPVRLGGKDEIANYNPACRRCNHYKRANSLAGFRALMRGLRKRVEDIYIVKVAIDYKIISIKDFDGRFYFEKEK